MSKLAKKPIIIPENIVISYYKNQIIIEGPLGKNVLTINNSVININQIKNKLFLNRSETMSHKYKKNSKTMKSILGTTYSLLIGEINGVLTGFRKKLILIGLGFKVNLIKEEHCLILWLGYSHPLKYYYPNNIWVECPTQTEIIINGLKKQVVGQVAATIYNFRVPDKYKGKGIRYENQIINLKEIKKK